MCGSYWWWSEYDNAQRKKNQTWKKCVDVATCLKILETKGGTSLVKNIWAWTNISSCLGEETRKTCVSCNAICVYNERNAD